MHSTLESHHSHVVATAYHEAAHAVVAEATGCARVRVVSIVPKVGQHGFTQVRSVKHPLAHRLLGDSEGERYLRAYLLQNVAGVAANRMRGEETPGWDDDVELDEMGLLEPACGIRILPGGKNKDGTAYDPSEAPSDYETARVLAAWLSVGVDHALGEARALLGEPDVWGAVERCARALLVSSVLSGEQFREVVGADLSAHARTSLEVLRRFA